MKLYFFIILHESVRGVHINWLAFDDRCFFRRCNVVLGYTMNRRAAVNDEFSVEIFRCLVVDNGVGWSVVMGVVCGGGYLVW